MSDPGEAKVAQARLGLAQRHARFEYARLEVDQARLKFQTLSPVVDDHRFEVGNREREREQNLVDVIGAVSAFLERLGQVGDQLTGRRIVGGIHRQDVAKWHRQSPYSARAVTRYVAGAILAASRWLQRRAWVRRAAGNPRPSGTMRNKAVAP